MSRGIIDERTNAYKKFPCSSVIPKIFDNDILFCLNFLLTNHKGVKKNQPSSPSQNLYGHISDNWMSVEDCGG